MIFCAVLKSLGGWKGWKEVYERLLEYISQQNVFICTGKELVEYWQNLNK